MQLPAVPDIHIFGKSVYHTEFIAGGNSVILQIVALEIKFKRRAVNGSCGIRTFGNKKQHGSASFHSHIGSTGTADRRIIECSQSEFHSAAGADDSLICHSLALFQQTAVKDPGITDICTEMNLHHAAAVNYSAAYSTIVSHKCTGMINCGVLDCSPAVKRTTTADSDYVCSCTIMNLHPSRRIHRRTVRHPAGRNIQNFTFCDRDSRTCHSIGQIYLCHIFSPALCPISKFIRSVCRRHHYGNITLCNAKLI